MSAHEIKARLNRRQFLQFSGLGLALTASGHVVQVSAEDHSGTSRLSAYITVGDDGVIIIGAPNPEVGRSGSQHVVAHDYCRRDGCCMA